MFLARPFGVHRPRRSARRPPASGPSRCGVLAAPAIHRHLARSRARRVRPCGFQRLALPLTIVECSSGAPPARVIRGRFPSRGTRSGPTPRAVIAAWPVRQSRRPGDARGIRARPSQPSSAVAGDAGFVLPVASLPPAVSPDASARRERPLAGPGSLGPAGRSSHARRSRLLGFHPASAAAPSFPNLSPAPLKLLRTGPDDRTASLLPWAFRARARSSLGTSSRLPPGRHF